MNIHVVQPADAARIELILDQHEFRIDIRGIYPTLIRGNQAWQCQDYNAARALAMRMIAVDNTLLTD
jgi:hypothetical protein